MSEHNTTGIARAEPPLLERDQQLALFGEWLADARRGRGRLALVLGGAGLGKSSLLDRARALARESGVATLSARGGELEREMPFGIARQLFETPMRRLPESEQSIVFSGAATHTRSLLGFAAETPAGSDLLGVIHSLYWLLANLSDRGPLLLLIDDLHWIDTQTARWLAYLGTRVGELPVLVLAAARPAERGREQIVVEIADLPGSVPMFLEPLGASAVAELLRFHLGPLSEEGFVVACLNATGGNPFFLRELMRAAVRDGLGPFDANARLVPELGTKEIARAILVRLARLGAGAKRLADAAALLGGDAALPYAAALAGLERNAALDAWDALIRGEILTAGQPLEFIHPIARTAIYNEMAPGKRSRAHRQAASILNRDGASDLRVAAHALLCEPSGDQEVVAWLRAAGETALLEGAPDAATHYIRRALAEPPAPGLRPDLHFELGSALVGLDTSRAAESFGEAAKELDGSQRLRAWREQAFALGYAGLLGEAMAVYDRAIELAGPATDAGLHLIGTRDFYGAWWAAAPDRETRRIHARELADSLAGSTTGQRQVLAAAVVTAIHDGSMPASRAMGIVRRLGRSELTWLDRHRDVTQGCAAFASIICDDAGAAALFENRAIPECVSQGRLVDLAFAVSCLANIRFREGKLLDAEARGRTAWEIVPVARASAAVVYYWAAATLTEILLARGAVEEAAELLEESGLASHPPPIVLFPWPECLRGELMLARGRTAEGVEVLLETGAWLEERGFGNPAYIPWRARVAPALASLGRRDEAREVIGPAVRRARQFGAPWALGMALRAAGTVEQGRPGVELLREAVAVLQPSAFRLEQAHAALELGAALRRANHRADARPHLRAALDLATRCTAEPLAKRAREELAATGARPRRVMLTGVESLTASERRIAELAAAGSFNREIAQALFVTRKTVESHLGSAYRKLGVSSREQLADALNAPGSAA